MVDGAEALRNRESINATRKLINNQVVGQVKHPDNQAERIGNGVWLLGLVLAFLVLGVILSFKRTIYGF